MIYDTTASAYGFYPMGSGFEVLPTFWHHHPSRLVIETGRSKTVLGRTFSEVMTADYELQWVMRTDYNRTKQPIYDLY